MDSTHILIPNKTTTSSLLLLLPLLLTTAQTLLFFPQSSNAKTFPIHEATIREIQQAFKQKKLTSTELVQTYLERINTLNATLRAVIEVNPDALAQAKEADEERRNCSANFGSSNTTCRKVGLLHGIPILLKDNIATKDRLNTTAGSYALVGSVVARDAGVVSKLRNAGAVVLGKASLSQWSAFRSTDAPDGWCARSGKGLNPYNTSADPCGSSSGSAISVAANMVAVSLGTETAGSILCPSDNNGVVGIKPTVGLTSRSGVIPISPRQDTVGPIFRTVEDAVHVLDAIVGYDPYDAKATNEASGYIPMGGYVQFLKLDGLRGKRIGIVRNPFFDFTNGSAQGPAFNKHLQTLRQREAVLIDNLEIANIASILSGSDMFTALMAEFKPALRSYLEGLVSSPVRSLTDVRAFNNDHQSLESLEKYNQAIFLESQLTNGTDTNEVKKALENLAMLNKNGFEKTMVTYNLDAILIPGADFAYVLAIEGYPGISVPAGYNHDGQPFGACFAGLKGYEPRLIEIAYDFEQSTSIRKPPPPLL